MASFRRFQINAKGAQTLLGARNERNHQVLARICEDAFIGDGCSEASAGIAIEELRRVVAEADDLELARDINDLACALRNEIGDDWATPLPIAYRRTR